MIDARPIRLTLVEREGPGDLRVAAGSPLLDPSLHPGRTVTLAVSDEAAVVRDGGSVELGPFQRASVEAYVRAQESIRRRIEVSLKAELAALVDADRGRDVWSRVKVVQLFVGPRKVPTPEGLALMQKDYFPGESLGQVAAKFDNADTRSGFTVALEVDWDEEHQRWAQFRDDVLVSFSAE